MDDKHAPARARARVGIIGAGSSGAQLALEFDGNRRSGRKAVAFFDDDFRKWQKHIHDVPVVGMPDDFRPLVLDDEGRLYLYRYWQYESQLARDLLERACDADDVDPALIKSYTVNDKLYLVPAAWNNMMIYYNTKVFKDAGIERPSDDWTWDDFLAIAKQLTKGEGANQTYGYGIPYFNFGIHPWFLSNGAPLLKNDLTESNLNDPKVVEAAQFLHDLVLAHLTAPTKK